MRTREPAKSYLDLITEFSASRYKAWTRCQQQFYYIYVEGQREAPSAALAFGKTHDVTCNTVYDAEIEKGEKQHEAKEVKDMFAAEWENQSMDVEDWGDNDKGEMLDQGVIVAGLWRDQVAEVTKPIATQIEVRVPHDDWTLYGIVDLAASSTVEDEQHLGKFFVDNKTSKRRWNLGQAENEIQSTTYSIFAENDPELGVSTDWFRYDIAVRKKAPEAQRIMVPTPATNRGSLISRMNIARRQITHAWESGDWLPNREHQLCSRRWCAFWERCQLENKGTVKE